MNTFAAILIAFTAIAIFGDGASPLTAALVIALGAAILIIGQRNSGDPSATSRVLYLIGTLAYLIALPWLHQHLIPHYHAAPMPIAWLIPILYLTAIPFALPLMPLISRASYARDAWRIASRGRRYQDED